MENQELQDIEIIEGDDAREVISERLSSLWWTFVLRGALAACLGIAALFWPADSLGVLVRIAGVLLLLDGGLTIFGLGHNGAAGRIGIGGILIGLVLLIWPEGVLRLSAFLIGAWVLLIGIGSLVTWRRIPKAYPEHATARNTGFVALAIGLVLLFWPGTGLVALGWALAFAALAVAAVMFWLAVEFRRANERIKLRVVNP